jgi:hypothetical protein
MGFMDYDSQVPLIKLKGFPDRPFFANNNSRVYDPKIIDTAVGMVDCVSRSNWTLIPPQTDQRSHGKLDSHSRPT